MGEQDAKEHRLKTWPSAFEAVLSGRKTHEWRRDDRRYAVGDRLVLQEFVPCDQCNGSGRVRDHTDMEDCGCAEPHGAYTGRRLDVCVTFVTRHPEFGVPDGWVVMSIGSKLLDLPPRDPRVDPQTGDFVQNGAGEKAKVLEVLTSDNCDWDHALGKLPHVVARVDRKTGRRTETMSLATWRAEFASA